MVASAILVISTRSLLSANGDERGVEPAANPIANLEVLGRTILEHTVARLRNTGIHSISVANEASLSLTAGPCFIPEILMKHAEKGIARVLVLRLGAYAEVDFADLLQFHSDTGAAVTRVCDAEGPLDIWVLDAVPGTRRGLSLDLSSDASLPGAYRTLGYVNRLTGAQDLRRLAVDAFSGRCAIRPRGRQMKPGVWIDEGARVHRSARIVAPAYIGQGARVRASALITRFSNVERRCVVDCGTAIENSSVLPFTRVGRGLDVAHSVIEGDRLMNLSRNVVVTIEDPKLFGRTASRQHWFGLGGQRIEAVAQGTGTVEIEPVPREAPRQQPALGVLSKGEV